MLSLGPASLEPGLAALGISVPDSTFARRARELAVEAEPAFLVNHSVRAYAWAVAPATHDGVDMDPEILYVAALLHDIGLVPAYDLGGCFELDGAIAARELALRDGQPAQRVDAIHDAIARHMAAELPAGSAPEVALLWDSTGVDVTGYRYGDLPAALIAAVLAAYPRLDFKREFGARFAAEAARKPDCRVAEMIATGKLDAISAAPFAE